MDHSVKVGQIVRLANNHQRGRVAEVDHAYHAARVELNAGGERWERLDELEIVEPWDTRRRTA